MENKRQSGGSSSSSSSSSSINFDHLFGSSSSPSPSTTSGLLGSIFPPPSTGERNPSQSGTMRKNGESSKEKNKNCSVYQNSEVAEPSYLSSSIHYGGRENYSPRTRNTPDQSHHVIKKDGDDDDPNGNNANSASRGNWWQGSLYY